MAYTVEWSPLIESQDLKRTLARIHVTFMVLGMMSINQTLKIVVISLDRVEVYANNGQIFSYRASDKHNDRLEQFEVRNMGLAAAKDVPQISGQLNEHYYREFDLFLVLDNPTDYLSYVLCEQTSQGYKSGLGYYPTPFQITRMMVEMVHGDGDAEAMKKQTVYDPCVGCGAMLLPASNYFLRGYGQDISNIAVKLCTIQMYFYAPWFARPGQVKGFGESEPIQIVLEQHKDNESEGQMAFVY